MADLVSSFVSASYRYPPWCLDFSLPHHRQTLWSLTLIPYYRLPTCHYAPWLSRIYRWEDLKRQDTRREENAISIQITDRWATPGDSEAGKEGTTKSHLHRWLEWLCRWRCPSWSLLFDDKQELLGAPSKAEVRDIDNLEIAIEEQCSKLVNVKAVDLVVWQCKKLQSCRNTFRNQSVAGQSSWWDSKFIFLLLFSSMFSRPVL